MKILAIESSCDETAAAVVEFDDIIGVKLLSNVVTSSVDLHAVYGGVVPEIAARSHLEHINPVIDQALVDAGMTWMDIDGIAVTQGPGLGGSLLIGVLTARTLAILHEKPLYAVNHVLAHPYAAFITDQSPTLSNTYKLPSAPPKFPILALIVSGGHSQLVLFESHFMYTVLGRTLDDALGEAFDKVAKIIGLPYPGGPAIEQAAKKGSPLAFKFPDARLDNPYNFSFSGLKTAVLRAAQKEIGEDYTFPSWQVAQKLSDQQRLDIAASFQHAAIASLLKKLSAATAEYRPKSIIVAGGVAANRALQKALDGKLQTEVIYPDIKLCTDNAAMIATRGAFQITGGQKPADPYALDVQPNLQM